MSSATTTTPTTSHPIPFVYRLILTTIDPLFCILGFATHIFTPTATLQGYSPYAFPSTTIPAPPSTIFLLDNIASLFLLLLVLETVMLRVTHSRDVTAWRVVQAGGVLVDICMTFGAVRMIAREGRLGGWSDGTWRGDDWKNVVGNAGMGLVRLGVVMGWGIGKGDGGRQGIVGKRE